MITKGKAYYQDAKEMSQRTLASIEGLMKLLDAELDKYRSQHSFDY